MLLQLPLATSPGLVKYCVGRCPPGDETDRQSPTSRERERNRKYSLGDRRWALATSDLKNNGKCKAPGHILLDPASAAMGPP